MTSKAAVQSSDELSRALISELFHDLSQPLTALHCSLDIALRRSRTLEELQDGVQAALENAERLRRRLSLVRALTDACDPGDLSRPPDLVEVFLELQQDMIPLFESAGLSLKLETNCESLTVGADRSRLLRAMFCLIEYLFRYSGPGSALEIRIGRDDGYAEIRIAAASCLPVSPAGSACEPSSCEIEMARRSLRAVGGELVVLSHSSQHSVWRATVPIA